MAGSVDIAILSPVIRAAAPAVGVVSRAGLAFAAVLGQVAVVRGAQVKGETDPAPNTLAADSGAPDFTTTTSTTKTTATQSAVSLKNAAPIAPQAAPATSIQPFPTTHAMPQPGQPVSAASPNVDAPPANQPILTAHGPAIPIGTDLSPAPRSAGQAGQNDSRAAAARPATTIKPVAKKMALTQSAVSTPPAFVATPAFVTADITAGMTTPLVHRVPAAYLPPPGQPVTKNIALPQSTAARLPATGITAPAPQPRLAPATATAIATRAAKTTKPLNAPAAPGQPAPVPMAALFPESAAVVQQPLRPATPSLATAIPSAPLQKNVLPSVPAAFGPVQEKSDVPEAIAAAASPQPIDGLDPMPATSPSGTVPVAPAKTAMLPPLQPVARSVATQAASTDHAPATRIAAAARTVAMALPTDIAAANSVARPQPVAAAVLAVPMPVDGAPIPSLHDTAAAKASVRPNAGMPETPTAHMPPAPSADSVPAAPRATHDLAAAVGPAMQPLVPAPEATASTIDQPGQAAAATTATMLPHLSAAAAPSAEPARSAAVASPIASLAPEAASDRAAPSAAALPASTVQPGPVPASASTTPARTPRPIAGKDPGQGRDAATWASMPSIAPSDVPDTALVTAAAATPSAMQPVPAPILSTSTSAAGPSGKAAVPNHETYTASNPAKNPASSAAPAAQPPSATPGPQADLRDVAFQARQPEKDTPAATTTIATTMPGNGAAAAPANPDTPAAPTPAATPSPLPTPPPPAAQLANAAATLQVGADGTSHVTIRLDPAELGHVQIRISRATDGTASIDVAVERPETLASLQTDLGHLHQALDRAGLPDQRSVTMHLAAQPDQSGGTSLGSNTGSGSGFTPQGGFQQGARQQHQAAPHPLAATTPENLPAPLPQRAAAIAGSGVNITA